MEIQCPSCKKLNSDSLACVRCGCELKIIRAILQASEAEITMSKEKLLEGEFLEALGHAKRSWELKKTSDAAKLAFLANVSARKYEDALKWRNKMSKKEDSRIA